MNILSSIRGRPLSVKERLSSFPRERYPLDGKLNIYWNKYQVPYVQGETDHDTACGLGLVHAHLRGGQLAVFKMISQGRVAEMIGGLGVFIDKTIRSLGFSFATDTIVQDMPRETRAWLDAYVKGLNAYNDAAEAKPLENRLLGIPDEPYTVKDIVTLGRFVGNDVNWSYYFSLLRDRKSPGWARMWRRILDVGSDSATSFPKDKQLNVVTDLLSGLSRSGSNSMVVAPQKSVTGHGMMANDPHLGISLPNLWLLVGLHSPSYQVVGLMLPGLPFCGLGRNPHLAFGGTNMRAASSDLYDVSGLPPEAFEQTVESIKVRFGWTRKFVVKRTHFGPVLDAVPFLKKRKGEQLALRWAGHDASQDIDAFLKANRATSVEAFKDAFNDYSVSSLNMLSIDNSGKIALNLAVKLPKRRTTEPADLVLDATHAEHDWDGYVEAGALPWIVNPEEGFIASANNRTVATHPPISFFFGQAERIERLRKMLGGQDKLSVDDLKAIQRDVYSKAAQRLCVCFSRAVVQESLADESCSLQRALQDWDGRYDANSVGAAAFELLAFHLLECLDRGDRKGVRYYRTWNYITHYLASDLQSLSAKEHHRFYQRALKRAKKDWRRNPTWGQLHRLQLEHLLAKIPGVGKLFSFGEIPACGSRQTVMKSDHSIKRKRGYTAYGSQSRQISTMDDIDNNFFVLFGGTDGWLFSEGLTDQVELWKRGEYIRMPLRMETVKKEFPIVMQLQPQKIGSKLSFINIGDNSAERAVNKPTKI